MPPEIKIPVPAGATELILNYDFKVPVVVPPDPPTLVESIPGTGVTLGIGKIIDKDLKTWTLQPKVGGGGDNGLFCDDKYVTGNFVTSAQYQGNNVFIENTAGYGQWKKTVKDGVVIAYERIDTPPVVPPPPPTTGPFPAIPAGYKIHFEDFFTGLNENVWTKVTPQLTGDTRMDPANVSITPQGLEIKAKRVSATSITTGAVSSLGKLTWKQGDRLRILCKVMKGIGTHTGGVGYWRNPAPAGEGSPKGGEIDVFEQRGIHPQMYEPTIHSANDGGDYSKQVETGVVLAGDFHVYETEWTAEGFVHYFDGKQVHKATRARGDTYPYNREFGIDLCCFCNATPDQPGQPPNWLGVFPANQALPTAVFKAVQLLRKG